MDTSREIESLRAEQRRLRAALDALDARIATLARCSEAHEPLPPPLPLKPPAPVAPPPAPEKLAEILAPVAKIAASPRPEPVKPQRDSFELRFGQVWLVRLGIVILLTGFVFLGNYAYHEYIGRLGPWGKLLLIYAAGALLGALGFWLARRRDALKTYGAVLASGGCATIYYATYAAHFIPALRVIESPLLAGSLLLALGGLFVGAADRLRSRTLAAATVALSFYTAAINPVATFSLFSNLVISVAAVILLARRSWVSVSFLSLLGAYGSFAFWRFQQAHALGPVQAPGEFWPAVLFPSTYWIVNTAAVMLRRISAFDPATRPAFLTLNNAALFALAGPVIAGSHPDAFWLSAVIYGAVLLALSFLAARRAPDESYFDGSYLAQGLGLILLGLFYKFTGWQQAISFALLGATLISVARSRHAVVYRFFASVSAVVAAFTAMQGIADLAPHARLTAGGVASILSFTGWLARRRLVPPRSPDLLALGFATLAGCLAVPASFDGNGLTSGVLILSLALAAMAAPRLLGFPELAYVAQPVALCGQGLLFAHLLPHVSSGTMIASVAFGMAFLHLWQWRAAIPLAGRRAWQAIHSVPPVLVFLAWTFLCLSPDERGPVLALAALLAVAWSGLTRMEIFAAASAPLTLVSIALTAAGILDNRPWISGAGTLVLLVAQSLLLPRVVSVAGIRGLAGALRAVSFALGVGMIFAYAPADAWLLAFTGAALAFFLAACAVPSGELLLYAGALAAAGLAAWLGRIFISPAQWSDLAAFAVLAFAQQIGKRRLGGTGWFSPNIQAAICAAAALGTWAALHKGLAAVEGGFLLTIAWSLLALAVLGCGFLLKERAYRLLGLGILAAAIGRIFCVDVWQLETIYRILSFLVLGAVLLALGFLYNRHAETLRRWL